jgi:hypothetical protein
MVFGSATGALAKSIEKHRRTKCLLKRPQRRTWLKSSCLTAARGNYFLPDFACENAFNPRKTDSENAVKYR